MRLIFSVSKVVWYFWFFLLCGSDKFSGMSKKQGVGLYEDGGSFSSSKKRLDMWQRGQV